MPWTYKQSSGGLTDPNGVVIGIGYSGHGAGVNNPEMQDQPDVGPIPQGFWSIGPSFGSPTKGPVVCDLTPLPLTNTFGRSGFMLHGDSIEFAGQEEASHGCIIMSRLVRETVAASGDRVLQVIS